MSRLRKAASLVALCGALALAACERANPPAGAPEPSESGSAPGRDEDLAQLVPSLVDSIQAKQSSFVMEHVSPSFKEDGGLDYYDVRALVESFALRPEAVGARLESSQLTPEAEGRQRVAAHVAFAPSQRLTAGEPLPAGGVVYAIEVVFEKSGAKWLAVGGRYKRELPPVTAPATLTTPATPSIATR